MYVVDHTLPYLILELPELSNFNLTIDCSHLQIKQNGNIVNKINKYKNERKYSLHINEETYVTLPHSQISEDQNVLPHIAIENRYQNNYYEPVEEARELALQRTIDYHVKNKIRYNSRCIEKKTQPSDEAHFWLNGYVNKQNCRIWSEANPQVYVETPLHPEKLTVWCALWAGGILLQKR
ncbi:hypothetical protein TNCV_2816341 [Trichonephila clavipes]|nr:hypothetical protein TNCV_2816341 [Trichonephila clavipes]